MQNKILVWKHHISHHFEEDPSLLTGNGVGKGGTVFLDYEKMVDWLKENDSRKFHVVPLLMNENDLHFCYNEVFMADSKISLVSDYSFAPIDSWKIKSPYNFV